MPDHVHAIISFPQSQNMASCISNWKRYNSRKLKIQWQQNFFDHRLRNDAEVDETYLYIMDNPVRKELVGVAEDWPHKWQSA